MSHEKLVRGKEESYRNKNKNDGENSIESENK